MNMGHEGDGIRRMLAKGWVDADHEGGMTQMKESLTHNAEPQQINLILRERRGMNFPDDTGEFPRLRTDCRGRSSCGLTRPAASWRYAAGGALTAACGGSKIFTHCAIAAG